MEGERYDGNSVGKNRLCFPRSGLGLVKNCHGFKTFLSFMISSKRVDHQLHLVNVPTWNPVSPANCLLAILSQAQAIEPAQESCP